MLAAVPASQPLSQHASCVAGMIGSRSLGLTSVLKPKTVTNALAVPLSQALFLRPRIVPRASRWPETFNPRSWAMPGHTRSDSSVSCASLGKPCLQTPGLEGAMQAGRGFRDPSAVFLCR